MKPLGHIKGKIIKDIQRFDTETDYEFYYPFAIVISFDNETEKLIISNGSYDKNIRLCFSSKETLDEEHGINLLNMVRNQLKEEDQLHSFINEHVKDVRTAEYRQTEIIGADFVIPQGKTAGIEIRIENQKLYFFASSSSGLLFLDGNEMRDLINKRWEWKSH